MTEKIKALKRSVLYSEWDGVGKPCSNLVQYVYDWFYPDIERVTPDKETRLEIVEFLRIIKEEEKKCALSFQTTQLERP